MTALHAAEAFLWDGGGQDWPREMGWRHMVLHRYIGVMDFSHTFIVEGSWLEGKFEVKA